MLKFIPANGGQHQVKELVGRRKLKNSYEYEVAWVDMREKYNTWMSREKCAPHLALDLKRICV